MTAINSNQLYVLVFCALLPLASFQAALAESKLSKNKPCMDERIVDIYESKNPNYHFYSNANLICTKTQIGCTRQTVFNMMISELRFIAPSMSSAPVANCQENLLMGIKYLSSGDPIRTTVNNPFLSITNYTLPGHTFHPGKVVRRVQEINGAIVVRTSGFGIGDYKKFNENLGPEIWGVTDLLLAIEMKRKYRTQNPEISASCNKQVDSVKRDLVTKGFFVPYRDALPGVDAKPKVRVDKTQIRKFWFDYPEDRTNSVVFLLGKVDGLWKSPKYMASLASSIIQSCSSVGFVSFAWMLEGEAIYGYFPSGEIKEFKRPSQAADYRQIDTPEGNIGQYRWGFHENP